MLYEFCRLSSKPFAEGELIGDRVIIYFNNDENVPLVLDHYINLPSDLNAFVFSDSTLKLDSDDYMCIKKIVEATNCEVIFYLENKDSVFWKLLDDYSLAEETILRGDFLIFENYVLHWAKLDDDTVLALLQNA